MQTTITQMMDFLTSLPFDTQDERSLLENLVCCEGLETILVAGDADAAPYTLLPLEEQLFEPVDAPNFPLTAEYGDSFSIHVLNQDGETECYQSISDFRHFCAPRFRQLHSCTVRLPNPLLREQRLVYFQFDQELSALNEAAKGCSGCIMVLAANAGGLSEDYSQLCHWLKDERCIASRVNLILNQQIPICNRMLPLLTENLLDRKKLAVFRCGVGRDTMTAEQALKSALLDLQERDAPGAERGVLTACRTQVTQKLQAQLQQLQTEAAEAGRLAEEYRKAEITFRAMCDSEKYSLASLLTQEDMESIRREIRGMFAKLQHCFPQMVDEVVKKSRDSKEDLKNLAGDYLGNLSDAFLSSLMEDVSDRLLVPRTNERFQNVCDRFRRMMSEAQLDAQELEEHVEAEFLRLSDVNIGDYKPQMAVVLSDLLTMVVRAVLIHYLDDWGRSIANVLNSWIKGVLLDVAIALTPKEMFANALCQKIMEHWDELEKDVCQQVESTLLPRLTIMLQEKFEKLTAHYDVQLLRKAEALSARQAEAQAQSESLRKQLAWLEVEPV